MNLPYIQLGRWLYSLSAGNYAKFSKDNNSRTRQRRAMKLLLLDFLGSWKSIYAHFNTMEVENPEVNHSEDDGNTKLGQ